MHSTDGDLPDCCVQPHARMCLGKRLERLEKGPALFLLQVAHCIYFPQVQITALLPLMLTDKQQMQRQPQRITDINTLVSISNL